METKKQLRAELANLSKAVEIKDKAHEQEIAQMKQEYSLEIEKWRVYKKGMNDYIDSAEIKERKELKRISKKGKIKWVEYDDDKTGIIKIDGDEYDAALFKNAERRTVPYLKYAKGKPMSPDSMWEMLNIFSLPRP